MQLNLFSAPQECDWTPPTTLPDLSGVKTIGLDCETRDPNLKSMGMGCIRGDGEMVGFSVALEDGAKWYFPFAHAQGGGNLDKGMVMRWIKPILEDPTIEKVGANILYDACWFQTEGIKVNGKLDDVQVREALINEELFSFSLDSIAKNYGFEGKDETLLNEVAQYYGADAKADLWKIPAKFVGTYAERDALLPLLIRKKQQEVIAHERLESALDIELRLLPLLRDMYFKGVRVDVERAIELAKQWRLQEQKELDHLFNEYRFKGSIYASADIAKVFDSLSLPYGRTEAGNPTFTKDVLKGTKHPFADAIVRLRSLNKLRTKFLETDIINSHVNGRIHANFNSTRKGDDASSDVEGTRTGRFSSSKPNLQQVPKRDKILAPLVRGLFLPEEGELWNKMDYSQQEPRIQIHYGYRLRLNGAQSYRQMYIDDPNLDFYEPITVTAGISRDDAKIAALGRGYGMSLKSFARTINATVGDAKAIMKAFDSAVPFVAELFDMCRNKAEQVGYIKTILGRRRHFNLFVPKGEDYTAKPLPLELAERKYRGKRLARFNTKNAFNSLIQGSAGDMTKVAMVRLYEDMGVVPLLTVHDEVDTSVVDESQAHAQRDVMETALKLDIPIKCDIDLGQTWV